MKTVNLKIGNLYVNNSPFSKGYDDIVLRDENFFISFWMSREEIFLVLERKLVPNETTWIIKVLVVSGKNAGKTGHVCTCCTDKYSWKRVFNGTKNKRN